MNKKFFLIYVHVLVSFKRSFDTLECVSIKKEKRLIGKIKTGKKEERKEERNKEKFKIER